MHQTPGNTSKRYPSEEKNKSRKVLCWRENPAWRPGDMCCTAIVGLANLRTTGSLGPCVSLIQFGIVRSRLYCWWYIPPFNLRLNSQILISKKQTLNKSFSGHHKPSSNQIVLLWQIPAWKALSPALLWANTAPSAVRFGPDLGTAAERDATRPGIWCFCG